MNHNEDKSRDDSVKQFCDLLKSSGDLFIKAFDEAKNKRNDKPFIISPKCMKDYLKHSSLLVTAGFKDVSSPSDFNEYFNAEFVSSRPVEFSGDNVMKFINLIFETDSFFLGTEEAGSDNDLKEPILKLWFTYPDAIIREGMN